MHKYLVFFNYSGGGVIGSIRKRMSLDHEFGSKENDEEQMELLALEKLRETDQRINSIAMSNIVKIPF